MPALDLALGLRVEGRAAHVAHALGFDIFGQFARDVAGSIIRQQAWPVMDMCLIAARCRQRQVQRIGDVLCPHGGAQLPGDDVARVIVEYGGEVHPTPADNLEAWPAPAKAGVKSVCHISFGRVVWV